MATGILLHNAADGTEDVSPPQFRALSDFRYQIRKFLHFSEEAARGLGLEPQQHQLLLAVKGFDGEGHGPTIGYLAERLQVRHHSAVELVDRLESHGLVQRHAAEHDRRQVIVTLSDAAERVLRDLSAQHIAEILHVGPGLVAALQQVIDGESNARTGGPEHT
jgi:DNA-binding MarR family transcriptional regulator